MQIMYLLLEWQGINISNYKKNYVHTDTLSLDEERSGTKLERTSLSANVLQTVLCES